MPPDLRCSTGFVHRAPGRSEGNRGATRRGGSGGRGFGGKSPCAGLTTGQDALHDYRIDTRLAWQGMHGAPRVFCESVAEHRQAIRQPWCRLAHLRRTSGGRSQLGAGPHRHARVSEIAAAEEIGG